MSLGEPIHETKSEVFFLHNKLYHINFNLSIVNMFLDIVSEQTLDVNILPSLEDILKMEHGHEPTQVP